MFRSNLAFNRWLVALAFIFFVTSVALAAVTHDGKVTSVGKSRISLLDKSGDNESFEVTPDAKITHNGKPAELTDIDEGDIARVTLKQKDGKFVAVAIDARDSE